MSKVLTNDEIDALVNGVHHQPAPQLANTRCSTATPKHTAFGQAKPLCEWAEQFGCTEQWLSTRLKRSPSIDPVLLLEGTLREVIRRFPRSGSDDLQAATRYQSLRLVPVRFRPPASPSEAQVLADLEEVLGVSHQIKQTVATIDEWEVLLGLPRHSLRGPVWYAGAFHPTLPHR